MAKARRKALVAHSPNPSNRTSKFKGVTRHRLTGRFEAHLWDKDCWNSSLGKKGKQVYLGAYDDEKDAAKAHDLAALKFWGPATTVVNFPLSTYSKALAEMENLSKEEYLALLRRNSSGFSRGVSKYRGVARHHQNGRWEARIGRVLGNKYLYLGTYDTQEEAAAAYDRAAIQHRGPNAVTNFDISVYMKELQDEEPLISRDLDEISPPNIPKFDTHALVSLNSSQDFGLLVDTGTFGDYTVENTEMEALFEFSVTSGLADSSSTANDDADTEASKIHMFGIKQSTEQELSGVDNHHDYILSNSIDPLVLEDFSSCSHNISSQD